MSLLRVLERGTTRALALCYHASCDIVGERPRRWLISRLRRRRIHNGHTCPAERS